MATSVDFINYVCEQLDGIGLITYKKMFGEYMVYLNEKPVIIVCENTAFVKKLECIKEYMDSASVGFPYNGAKEHYILDIDNSDLCKKVVLEIEKVTQVPKKKKQKQKAKIS